MQRLILTLIALLVAGCASTASAVALEHCMTGDSAICAADPNCHWDFQHRGCYEGPAPHEDACAAHEGKDICNGDTTIGCKWNAEKDKCESAN
jgi:hypothetical protein